MINQPKRAQGESKSLGAESKVFPLEAITLMGGSSSLQSSPKPQTDELVCK